MLCVFFFAYSSFVLSIVVVELKRSNELKLLNARTCLDSDQTTWD